MKLDLRLTANERIILCMGGINRPANRNLIMQISAIHKMMLDNPKMRVCVFSNTLSGYVTVDRDKFFDSIRAANFLPNVTANVHHTSDSIYPILYIGGFGD